MPLRRPSSQSLPQRNEMLIHGGRNLPEYRVWSEMRRRCKSKTRDSYKHYYACGIKVSDEWENSFAKFYADMGPRPSPKHTIDRIDPRGNYELGNCRWATPTTQANNRRDNFKVIYRNVEMTLGEAIRLAGSVIHRSAARSRISKYGWPVEKAIETAALWHWRRRADF